jgi:tRNA(Ile)-lysidine synthetase-like protein
MTSLSFCDQVGAALHAAGVRGTSLCAAVSGGADSVALVYSLYRLRTACGIHELGIVHVHHGLRGEAADKDEAYVRQIAVRLGLRFHGARIPPHTAPAHNIEAWARARRYAIFRRLMCEEGYDRVLTGHTLDDQAETVLMRSMRDAGVYAMQGIRALREDGILRPLLHISKQTLLCWLDAEGIAYRHDASNDDTSFLRNQVRHTLLCRLQRCMPRCRTVIASWADHAVRISGMLEPVCVEWERKYVRSIQPGIFAIHVQGLQERRAGDALAYFFRTRRIPLRRRHIEIIRTPCAHGGERLLLANGWQCQKQKTRHIVFNNAQLLHTACLPAERLSMPGHTCSVARAIAVSVTRQPAGTPVAGKSRGDEMHVYMDADTCAQGLWLRSLHADDTFVPFGHSRPQRCRSFLQKQGYPALLHAGMQVLVTNDDRIVMVPGVRPAETVRVHPRTRHILGVRCTFF